MSGGDYDVLVENRSRRRTLGREKSELVGEIIALENELSELREDAKVNTLEIAPPIEAKIKKLEAKLIRIERDIQVLDCDYEATLRIVFGSNFKKVRHDYSDDAFHIYYQGLGENRGDGIGHGHAILYPDGRVELIREAFASGIPLTDARSNRIRTKQSRRGKHHSSSHKNPKFIYTAQE